jgi:hypothetical protein
VYLCIYETFKRVVGGIGFSAYGVGYLNVTPERNQFLVFQKNINPFISSQVVNLTNIVLDTDYVNYALIYICLIEPNISTGQIQANQYSWMLTRSVQMSAATLNIMASNVANLVDLRTNKNLGISVKNYTVVPQIGCSTTTTTTITITTTRTTTSTTTKAPVQCPNVKSVSAMQAFDFKRVKTYYLKENFLSS